MTTTPPADPSTAGEAPPAPYSPAPMRESDERTIATLTHVSSFFFPFLGPLVALLVFYNRSRFVAHHAKEQLNLAISLFLYVAIAIVATIATLGIALLAIVPLAIVVPIGAFVFTIVAAVAASRGEWYRFPLIFRLIP